MARPGVMIYFDFRSALDTLSDRELGQMLRAILDYGQFQIIPQWKTRPMQMMWEVLLPRLDADRISYEQKVEKRRKAARCKWVHAYAENAEEREIEKEREIEIEREREIERETEKESPVARTVKTPFSPPSVSQVDDYCRTKGFPMYGERFVAYYTARGWMLGSTPMEDWKAALHAWNIKDKEKQHGLARTCETNETGLGPIGIRI